MFKKSLIFLLLINHFLNIMTVLTKQINEEKNNCEHFLKKSLSADSLYKWKCFNLIFKMWMCFLFLITFQTKSSNDTCSSHFLVVVQENSDSTSTWSSFHLQNALTPFCSLFLSQKPSTFQIQCKYSRSEIIFQGNLYYYITYTYFRSWYTQEIFFNFFFFFFF